MYKDHSIMSQTDSVQCQCEDYKKDIENLKAEIEIQKKKGEDVEHLKGELIKVCKLHYGISSNNFIFLFIELCNFSSLTACSFV